eukprot:3868218-Heterocapsa_arctica.AAC.1
MRGRPPQVLAPEECGPAVVAFPRSRSLCFVEGGVRAGGGGGQSMPDDGVGRVIRCQDPLIPSVGDVRGDGLDGEVASWD